VIELNRVALRLGLLLVACGTLGGKCVVVEEGPYGMEPGENEEVMLEQEEEVRGDSDF